MQLALREQAKAELGTALTPQQRGGKTRVMQRRIASPNALILATARRLINAGTPRHVVNRRIVAELAAAGHQVKFDTVRKVRWRSRNVI
jgi:hypothetical protein